MWPPLAVPSPSSLGFASAAQAPVFPTQSPQGSAAPSLVPAPFQAVLEEPGAVNALPIWQPPREERNVPLGIFFVLVLGFAGWMVWENNRSPMIVELKAPMKPPTTEAAVKPKGESSPLEVVTPPLETVTEPQPEIRKAELPFTPDEAVSSTGRPDLVMASEAANNLLKSLLTAKSASQRAETIAQPEDNRADLEGFFERNRLALKSIRLAEGLPLLLPGSKTVPLFEVVTDKNRAGALLRLVPRENGFLLDWPLFSETYECHLAGYLEKKTEQPSWFHVLLRRSHALELSEAVRSRHLCMELRASADDSVRCLAVVPEETPLGRFFESEVDWGNHYLARLLLQKRRQVDGTEGVVILDCEGAAITQATSSSRVVK